MTLDLIKEIVEKHQDKKGFKAIETTNFMLNDLHKKGIGKPPTYPEKDFNVLFSRKGNLLLK